MPAHSSLNVRNFTLFLAKYRPETRHLAGHPVQVVALAQFVIVACSGCIYVRLSLTHSHGGIWEQWRGTFEDRHNKHQQHESMTNENDVILYQRFQNASNAGWSFFPVWKGLKAPVVFLRHSALLITAHVKRSILLGKSEMHGAGCFCCHSNHKIVRIFRCTAKTSQQHSVDQGVVLH